MPEQSFADIAHEALPVEASYAYHQGLRDDSGHTPARDPEAVPADHEIAIAGTGWSICIDSAASPGLQFAARDLRDFLALSMQVDVSLDTTDIGAAGARQVIVAGTPANLSGRGADLTGSKDYEILVGVDRIEVCGFDEAGAQFGLLHLQERLRLRGAPFLPRDLRTVRHSLFRTRAVLSWLGWMQWPDSVLAHLARDGYDALFASVYANPNGVPGPPHYDLIRQQTPEALHDVIRRAGAHGLKVYCPILWANDGTPENEAGLRDHVRCACGVSGVGHERERFSAGLRDEPDGFVDVVSRAAGDGDGYARLAQGDRECSSEATTGAGDDSNLAGEVVLAGHG